MGLLFILIALTATFLISPLHDLVAYLSSISHGLCQSLVPVSRFSEQYDAMVCGTALPAGSFKNDLRISGLIHLMVVSGSHLLFLRHALLKIGLPERLMKPLLFLYCLVTDLQIPAVRGFFSILLHEWSEKRRLHWTSLQVVLLSGAMTWAFSPRAIGSFSFLLSWACALALALTERQESQERRGSPVQASIPQSSLPQSSLPQSSLFQGSLFRHAAVWLLLYPIALPLGPSHPVSVFFNWLLAPFLGAVLFPLSVLAFLGGPSLGQSFPGKIPGGIFLAVGDFTWSMTEKILGLFTSGLQPLPPQPVPRLALWVFLWVLHFVLHIGFIARRHRSARE